MVTIDAKQVASRGRCSPLADTNRTSLDAIDWATKVAEAQGQGEIPAHQHGPGWLQNGFDLETDPGGVRRSGDPVITSG